MADVLTAGPSNTLSPSQRNTLLFPFSMAYLSLSSLSPPPSSSSSSSSSSYLPLQLRGRIFSPFSRVQVSSSSSTSYLQPKVVVTREYGKNGKLINVLVRLSSFLFFSFSL